MRAALGYRRGLTRLVGGMCETDYSGYPDCRDATLQALEQAIGLGTEIPFAIETPLMWLTKADTWALAVELGGADLVDLIVEETHSCYRGERGTRTMGLWLRRLPRLRAPRQGLAAWHASHRAQLRAKAAGGDTCKRGGRERLSLGLRRLARLPARRGSSPAWLRPLSAATERPDGYKLPQRHHYACPL